MLHRNESQSQNSGITRRAKEQWDGSELGRYGEAIDCLKEEVEPLASNSATTLRTLYDVGQLNVRWGEGGSRRLAKLIFNRKRSRI